MPLILRKATSEDAQALTEIYFSAFSIDAISLVVFPRNIPAAWKFWYDSVIEEIVDPNAHFICVVDTDSPAQPIIAYAKWNSPSAPMSTDLPEWPEGSDHEIANHFFGNLVKKHAEIMEGRKHWYLEIIATRPEYQGKGAAGQLLRWGMARADEEGTETYLEASPDGKPIYEHFGFREVERLEVELKEEVLGEKVFIECFMIRPVIAKSN
ncbi:putative N-acetyltransferase [Hyphodiscus hymeniophilus]|uniref:N-acetyltransferase n=1 Tax=Hyphodiscus hymeniophilus TaxID=353542 RepID=A0A9P6VIE6_9HELO|nr:putative N-acetyltransferase [Hyphodiscus hymeniophilus]